MDRQYVPIRSAAPSSSRGPDSLGLLEPLETKKRRVGVSIACNTCRRKKIRCDGARPVCSNCHSLNARCTYRDDADLPAGSKKVVVDMIEMLNSLPAAEAARVLVSLRGEANASVVLSVLRDETEARNDASADQNSAAVTSPPASPFEFEVQNPIAYPVIPPPDPVEAGQLSYLDLTPFSKQRRDDEDPAKEQSESSSPSQSHLRSAEHSTLPSELNHLPELCDPRLQHLEIRRWTTVDIDNETAARCISLYLETDHPLLGHFDPELFVAHLISGTGECCSVLLVNALLYWACQMYGYLNPKTEKLAVEFGVEAERLWVSERASGRDSYTNLAAAEFICLGYLGQGKDHAILAYIHEASEMGKRMGLFASEEPDTRESQGTAETTDEATKARKFAAWGVFNWLTLMSLFYRQPGLFCPKYAPRIAIPDCGLPNTLDPKLLQSQSPCLEYMGKTFPHICRFWCIVHEVSVVYHGDGQEPWGTGGTIAFAEFKFRELLAWTNALPSRLSQGSNHPHHVQVLHLWFHAIILDIFRPFIQNPEQRTNRYLRTFSGRSTTPEDVCDASVLQLKRLITEYRLRYKSSKYTILWHTALIYVVNAILNDEQNLNWYADLLLCVYAYESLGRSWRVAGCIAKGLLSLALRKSELSSRTARKILRDLRSGGLRMMSGEIRATFMADLDLALSDPKSATMEHLAEHFEDNVWMKDYTTIFDDEERN